MTVEAITGHLGKKEAARAVAIAAHLKNTGVSRAAMPVKDHNTSRVHQAALILLEEAGLGLISLAVSDSGTTIVLAVSATLGRKKLQLVYNHGGISGYYIEDGETMEYHPDYSKARARYVEKLLQSLS